MVLSVLSRSALADQLPSALSVDNMLDELEFLHNPGDIVAHAHSNTPTEESAKIFRTVQRRVTEDRCQPSVARKEYFGQHCVLTDVKSCLVEVDVHVFVLTLSPSCPDQGSQTNQIHA